jgi:hypothetical protein
MTRYDIHVDSRVKYSECDRGMKAIYGCVSKMPQSISRK